MDFALQFGNYAVLIVVASSALIYRLKKPILTGYEPIIVFAAALVVGVKVSVEVNDGPVFETLLLQVFDRGTILISAIYGMLIGIVLARSIMYVNMKKRN